MLHAVLCQVVNLVKGSLYKLDDSAQHRSALCRIGYAKAPIPLAPIYDRTRSIQVRYAMEEKERVSRNEATLPMSTQASSVRG